jgi:hypothetical protein
MVLWLTALAVAARCVEGVVRQLMIGQEVSVVLEHDDSLILVLPFGLLAAAVIWRKWLSRAFFLVTLALIPASLYVMVINNRRAAFLCLFLAIATVVPLVWTCLRSKRQQRVFIAVLAVGAVLGAGYLGAFWNRSGGIAEPAQAVKSAFQPDERDYSSNMYRELENINLRYTIDRSPVNYLMGIGFGRPMDVIVEVVNLEGSWSWQFFMPHNNMLWLWMRMGVIGFVIFWIMIGMSVLLAVSAIRIGVLRLRALAAEERRTGALEGSQGGKLSGSPEPNLQTFKPSNLQTTHMQMGLVRYTPRVESRYEGRVERAAKPSPRSGSAPHSGREMQECAEMLVVAVLALTTVSALIGITIVDQGLMSFRIAAFTGVILGTLGAAWDMYYLRYRLPAGAAAEPLPEQEELPHAQRRRVRYLVRP